MYHSSLYSIKKEVRYLKRVRSKVMKLLSGTRRFDGWRLSSYAKGNVRYYKLHCVTGDRQAETYLGRTLTREAERVCERKVLQRILHNAENNLRYLEALEQHYLPVNPNELRECLPLSYRAVPPSVFEATETFDMHKIVPACYSDKSSRHHPEHLLHITPDGHRVRSKNELIAIYILEKLKIPFEYEHELVIRGKTLLVDLWLRHPNGSREAPLEVFGMMDNPDYREAAADRAALYIKAGFTPGKNAFIVYCDSTGPFDSRVLEQQLREWLDADAAA